MPLQNRFLSLTALSFLLLLLNACGVNTLEARLAADPQCKPVINQKTGAVMPCPGSSKDFAYLNAKSSSNSQTTSGEASPAPSPTGSVASSASAVGVTSNTTTSTTVADCKPQIHKKTGGTLPCPAP